MRIHDFPAIENHSLLIPVTIIFKMFSFTASALVNSGAAAIFIDAGLVERPLNPT